MSLIDYKGYWIEVQTLPAADRDAGGWTVAAFISKEDRGGVVSAGRVSGFASEAEAASAGLAASREMVESHFLVGDGPLAALDPHGMPPATV